MGNEEPCAPSTSPIQTERLHFQTCTGPDMPTHRSSCRMIHIIRIPKHLSQHNSPLLFISHQYSQTPSTKHRFQLPRPNHPLSGNFACKKWRKEFPSSLKILLGRGIAASDSLPLQFIYDEIATSITASVTLNASPPFTSPHLWWNCHFNYPKCHPERVTSFYVFPWVTRV